jgi:hypothetical protein
MMPSITMPITHQEVDLTMLHYHPSYYMQPPKVEVKEKVKLEPVPHPYPVWLHHYGPCPPGTVPAIMDECGNIYPHPFYPPVVHPLYMSPAMTYPAQYPYMPGEAMPGGYAEPTMTAPMTGYPGAYMPPTGAAPTPGYPGAYMPPTGAAPMPGYPGAYMPPTGADPTVGYPGAYMPPTGAAPTVGYPGAYAPPSAKDWQKMYPTMPMRGEEQSKETTEE